MGVYHRLDGTECAHSLESFLLLKHKEMQTLLLRLCVGFKLSGHVIKKSNYRGM